MNGVKKSSNDEQQDTSDQAGPHAQSQLVNMTVTEDNPIIIRRPSQNHIPTDEDPHVATETAMSLMSHHGAMVQANQSRSLQLSSTGNPAAGQVVPVEVKGGNYQNAVFGPTNTSAYKDVGIAGGDFRGAVLNPTYNSTTVINKTVESKQAHSSCQKHDGKCRSLTDSICFFPDEKLSTAPKSRVYKGVETSGILVDQPLAIKFVSDYTDKNQREARNLVTLRPHTNVVTIHKADACEQGPVKCMFIAMERCKTLNLESYIENRRKKNLPFNVKEAFEQSRQIIEAIHHIHKYKILHRDLKPSSVLFSLRQEVLKICDFGFSKQLERGHSVISLSMLKPGTDGYRAPETYNEDSITRMADIFSLGLVLHHLFSYGFHPFGLDSDDWNSNIKRGKNRDLSRLRVPFHENVKDLCEKMLQLRPNDRPSINEVRDEFVKFDWVSCLLKNLVEIWSGPIQDKSGDMLPCQLYCSEAVKDIVKINGMEWKFEMDTVKFLDISGLKKVTDVDPSGYIVTSHDEAQKLIDKLTKNNLMAWISISKDGEDDKVLILLCYPDYPELFGFFLPSRKSVSSVIEKLGLRQVKPEEKGRPDKVLVTTPTNQQVEPVSTTVDSDMGVEEEDDDIPRDEPQASQPHPELTENKEFIPWWIIDGN